MKKVFLYGAAALALASCSSDLDLGSQLGTGKSETINFQVSQKNVTRATALNKAGHYNFGVFAYKSTDKVNNIMDNYLVGYYDEANAYSKSGSTWGDKEGQVDGTSYWMYEGLGCDEFTGTYAGQRLNAGEQMASNVANQYLKYWDKAAESTVFYAYAPYVNKVFTTKEVTYVDGQAKGTSDDTYVMTIPNGTLKHGYDKEADYEFMYASKKVVSADYGHDVALNFNRLNAKVNIKFWEDIPGYNVRIIDVNNTYSVAATPAIKSDNDRTGQTYSEYGYRLGQIYTENGAKIQFADGAQTGMKQYEGTTTSDPLNFAAPTAAQIGESRIDATPSTTTYYAIPKGSDDAVLPNGADKYTETGTLNADLKYTGLTFHVSYELISTTGEVITVKDATVFVPTDYTNWKANTHYTYIFKITKGSNGSTDGTITPNPEDPSVPTDISLYPIVFDNCTVEDWATSESEHVISDVTTAAYHDVQLSTYSLVSGDIEVKVTDNDTWASHKIDYTKVAVTGPTGADMTKVTYAKVDDTKGKITVATGATAGLYTVTYTCVPPTGTEYNHPTTWTETFVVGNAYTVNTNLDEVGTHGLAATALSISATKDGNAITPAATELSIEYPVNLTAAEKALVKVSDDGTKVEVAKTAAPGKYKLVLKIDEGVEVKVAEKVFEVKDYQFALSKSIVELGATAVEITATDPSGVGVISMATATGITVDNTNKKISVANTAAEGTYTVTYTVQDGTPSKVQYEATFVVKNTYAVTVSKSVLQRDLNRANEADQGSDAITIKTVKNGEATTTDLSSALKIKLGNTDVTSKFAIAYTSANEYTLKVNKEADVNKVYTVEYTGQSDNVVTTEFTVQN